MVGTRYNPESSSASDEIYKIIHEEVATTTREAIPEMSWSIKTMFIETFDERYVAITEAATTTATAVVATSCC